MIDYKKAEQAYELLKQSNAPFMVAYGNKDGETITFGVSGNYRILRCCLAQLIAEMGNGMREIAVRKQLSKNWSFFSHLQKRCFVKMTGRAKNAKC